MVKPKKEEDHDDEQTEDVEHLKPGQKYPTPTPGFGDRVFYETLIRQRPDSIMAQEWCVNYGVLPKEEAAVLHKKMIKRKKTGGTGASATTSSASNGHKKSRGKKKHAGFDPGVDVVVSEGIGTTTTM